MPELSPGDIFAGHRIEGVAGRGGMGVVYRATQLDLERPVALKLIAAQLAEDPDFRERFVRESRIAASIDHPHVIPIYYAGSGEGTLYLAMRYVDGEDLRAVVRREGLLDPRRAARIVGQVGSALDAAHARGLVHRDVKPANVLLTADDHAYLTDFGLTKRLLDASVLSRSGQWVGTLGYVAPEQIRGQRVDARTDVFALGCVLFFALTGATPFQRESDEATLWAHLNDPPEPIDVLAPDVPSAFTAVVARALAKDPDDRYQSAGDLGRAALAAAGETVASEPERVVARGAAAPGAGDEETIVSPSRGPPPGAVGGAAATRVRRRRWAIAAAAAGAALTAVVVALALRGGHTGHGPRTVPTTARVRTTPTTTTPGRLGSPPVPGRVTHIIHTGVRVNSIAIAGGTVWASSHQSRRLVAIRQRDAKRSALAVRIAAGTSGIAAGSGSLWILNQTRASLGRLRLGSRRASAATGLLTPDDPHGQPIALTTGEGGVWVGIRTPGVHVPDIVERVTPSHGRGRVVKAVLVPGGVQDLAAGFGAIWVLNQRVQRLTRISVRTGDSTSVAVGGEPQHVTAGARAVWVSNGADDTVTEFNPYTLHPLVVGATGRFPTAIAARGHDVWVVAQNDGTVTHIDARTSQPIGDPFRVCAEPFTVTADAAGAWIGCVDGRVVRVTARAG